MSTYNNSSALKLIGLLEQRKGDTRKDENSDSPMSKRVKLEYMSPIKAETGMSLWMDGNGSIDLTMD